MKRSIVVAAGLALLVPGFGAIVQAQDHGHGGRMGRAGMGAMGAMGGMGASTDTAAAHSGVGIVKSIDAASGKVMLAHEPIASLGWPAMTMAMRVADAAALRKLSPGQRIEFELVQQAGAGYVIARIR